MNGLKEQKYLSVIKRRFDSVTAFLSLGIIVGVLLVAIGIDFDDATQRAIEFDDFRSFFFVVGGTFGCLLFQFDIGTFFKTFGYVIRSMFTGPVKQLIPIIDELDEAIINGGSILDLREGKEISGDLLNDIVHMLREKLFYEEIEDFISNRVASVFVVRKTAVFLLNKGAKIAPALGLLGTVIGLIEVLQSLENPANIGPAMSLALMTTAFGSVLGSMVFTPLAGRLEHHNILYLETHKLLMKRVSVLTRREDRRMNLTIVNKQTDFK